QRGDLGGLVVPDFEQPAPDEGELHRVDVEERSIEVEPELSHRAARRAGPFHQATQANPRQRPAKRSRLRQRAEDLEWLIALEPGELLLARRRLLTRPVEIVGEIRPARLLP